MAWHAIYNMETGRLVSFTTELLDELPEGLGSIECGEDCPDPKKWDPESRTFLGPIEGPLPVEEEASVPGAGEGEVPAEEVAPTPQASKKLWRR